MKRRIGSDQDAFLKGRGGSADMFTSGHAACTRLALVGILIGMHITKYAEANMFMT